MTNNEIEKQLLELLDKILTESADMLKKKDEIEKKYKDLIESKNIEKNTTKDNLTKAQENLQNATTNKQTSNIKQYEQEVANLTDTINLLNLATSYLESQKNIELSEIISAKGIDEIAASIDNLKIEELGRTFKDIKNKEKEIKDTLSLFNIDPKIIDPNIKLIEEKLDKLKKSVIKKGIEMGETLTTSVTGFIKDTDIISSKIGEGGAKILTDIEGTISSTAQLATSIASGDIIGGIKAAFGLLSNVINLVTDSIDQAHEDKINKLKKELDTAAKAYENFGEQAKKATGEAVNKNIQDQLNSLEEQKKILENIKKEEDAKKKTDKGKIDDYNSQIDAITAKQQEWADKLAGITADSAIDQFADSLVGAFAKGEEAAIAMGKTTKEILSNAVKESLKRQFLVAPINEAVAALSKSMEDGILSVDEQKAFENKVQDAQKGFSSAMEQYKDLFTDPLTEENQTASNSDTNTLQGQIRGASEETVSAVAGKLIAITESCYTQNNILIAIKEAIINPSYSNMTDDAENTTNLLIKQVQHLKNIESNTQHIIAIENLLKNSNTTDRSLTLD